MCMWCSVTKAPPKGELARVHSGIVRIRWIVIVARAFARAFTPIVVGAANTALPY